jgi:NADH-quinone oxidoreductase subunit L
MFLACGVGAFVAAIFHVMTHAFFKALLFLGSGSVIHGMHHEQDMRRMGNLRKYMPITYFTMMLGWLAICGIVPFAGFFSKDEILYKTFASSHGPLGNWAIALWVVGLVTAVMTAAYMTRMMWMTFFGTERFHEALPDADHAGDPAHAEETAFAMGDASDDEMHHAHAAHDDHGHDAGGAHDDHDDDHDDEHHDLPHDFKPHESPWTMTVPLVILAFLSTVGGLVGIPYAISSLFGAGDVNVFEHVLEPVIAKVGPKEHVTPAMVPGGHATPKTETHTAAAPVETKAVEHTAEAAHTGHSAEEISTERLLALVSLALAVGGIFIGIALFSKKPLRIMPKILQDKWRIDELYNGYIVDPITRLSREGLWKGFDLGFVDGIVNGIGHFIIELGGVVRQIQVGFVRSYAAFILFGALIVVGYFIYYGFKLIG